MRRKGGGEHSRTWCSRVRRRGRGRYRGIMCKGVRRRGNCWEKVLLENKNKREGQDKFV